MRPQVRRGVPARAGSILVVLAAALAAWSAPAEASPNKSKPTPKPTTDVRPGHGNTATPTPTPTPVATATGSPKATPLATPAATAVPVATTAAAVAPVRQGQPQDRETPEATARPSASPRATAAAAQHQRRRDSEGLSTVAHSFAQAATTSPQLPLGLLAAVLLFLAVQNRIDRRDPKLSVTEASSSLELEFRTIRRPEPPAVRRRRVPVLLSPAAGAVNATDVALRLARPDV